MRAPTTAEIEMRLLVEAIYQRYGHDFRDYSHASLKRRLLYAQRQMGARTLSFLQERVLHDADSFAELLQYLTVPVSEMFRDPHYYVALRRHVLPVLQTYASIKVWIAGCSTGEEAYSMAILLLEEGLLERAIVYATDINHGSLEKARTGVYSAEQVRVFTRNNQQSGGQRTYSE
jgi:chemotaxis protein methyltransferase CheR